MAGIAGVFDTSAQSDEDSLRALVHAMAEQVPEPHHSARSEIAAPCGLAMAAIGCSSAAQIAAIERARDGRLLVAIAGGNTPFTRLRAALRDADRSAPELIAGAISLFGIEETLRLNDSPLALAVWDSEERTLTLARDRFGLAPLFAAWAGTSFIFGSYLFSLLVHPRFRRELDHGNVAHYLRFSTSHSPVTPFTGAVRVPPGSIVTVRADRAGAPIEPMPVASIRADAELGLRQRFTGSADEATDALERALQTSIRESSADPAAPLGVFFSGGTDSTLIGAVAAGLGEREVHAFTTGFTEQRYDESQHARGIAGHLGLTHHVLPFTAADMRALMLDAPGVYQEPFGDLAAYPAMHLARAAAPLTPVVMTGDGGDELFMGRPRDFMLWRARQHMKRPVQLATSAGLDLLAAGAEQVRPAVDRYVPEALARYLRPTRIKKAAVGFRARSSEELIAAIFCDTLTPGEFVRDVHDEPLTHYRNQARWLTNADQDDRWRFAVFQAYTLEREVPKHQRALAAAGITYRSIFLHPAVTDLAWRLAPELRDHNDVSRALVRNVIERRVPRAVYAREKAGFNVPFDRWLRGPLRDIGEELLDRTRIEQQGIFHPEAIEREWTQHLSGKYDRRFILFDLISFQLWVESMARVRPAS
jgi:asparagine synthase (glutamine-hydrolysing)